MLGTASTSSSAKCFRTTWPLPANCGHAIGSNRARAIVQRNTFSVMGGMVPETPRASTTFPAQDRATTGRRDEGWTSAHMQHHPWNLPASTRSARGSPVIAASDVGGAHSRARTGACNKADDGLCRAPPCAAELQLPQHRSGAAVIVANWHRLLSHWTMMGANWPTNTDHALTSCSPGSFI